MSQETFKQEISSGYAHKGETIVLGAALYDSQPLEDTQIHLALKTMNRHGLIAGATGTGKTKTLQVIAEQLSRAGVPSLLMDLKGDLSGLAKAAEPNPKLEGRNSKLGLTFTPTAYPVEFLSLSEEPGIRLRATVSEFGPILFSKILDLNDTQSGVMALLFKYCDDNQWPLIDLDDVKEVLKYITHNGNEDFKKEYGRIAASTASAILRKIIELEQQKADRFFGEPSFDPEDLCRKNPEGMGVINVLRLTDLQDRPKLFSTFMLSLFAEVYSTFPEEGDLDKPKLCLFIDEAHLVFSESSKALLQQLQSIIKLIRSKGVGIFFCTQSPDDIPDEVLGQLGLKVQHALRAFTAKDRKSIKKSAENFPLSDHYDTATLLTSMGIGEALVTALDEKGRPSPLAATMLRAPASRMDALSPGEVKEIEGQSKLLVKYEKDIDRESAHEILKKKLEVAAAEAHKEKMDQQWQDARQPHNGGKRSSRSESNWMESLSKNTMVRQLGRTVMRELARGLLGVLGVKKR
ncbi:helicase HerA-like domain-containing protein [Roseivirga sp. BDSF3-8]|uniref:helicase HerA-like domain-containing protein n=1 Tax=Roseivirga sp. BDSF3-8 TaxID=3241598 RepID=UPI003531E1FD